MSEGKAVTETEAQDEPVVFLEEPDISYGNLKDQEPSLPLPTSRVIVGDAASTGLGDASVDIVVTSPPYWQKASNGRWKNL